MAVNGKKKGNAQENKLSLTLSKRFAEHTGIDRSFRRNPDSGSFWGASNQKRMATHDLEYAVFGDLICPRNFKFSIESKFYKTPPTFKSIVNGDITQWNLWLAQASQDADNAGKSAALIIKYNNVEEIVFVQQSCNLNLIINYKGWFVYGFESWLEGNTDSYFFE